MVKSKTKPNHHPLKRWRFEWGITLPKFAECVGMNSGYLSAIENRKREPSLAIAQAIVDATEGAVTLRDFVLDKPAKS